jgi:tetratricopeptide (TPR) repeat protein
MDLQDFKGQMMYFDTPLPDGIDELLNLASESYGEGDAEEYLQQAYRLAPNNMTVLVALYRFFYYQQRLPEAIDIAYQVMAGVAPIIGFPDHWRKLQFKHLAYGVMESFTLVRFYLLAVKGAAFMNLRIGNIAEGVEMLNKVVEFDSNDRLGARALLQSVGPAVVAVNTTTRVAIES